MCAPAGVLTSDYNAVADRFSTNGGTSVTSTLAQWRAFGNDTNSFVSTPAALFVNAAAKDFRLAAGSPAIDAGANLGADVATDIDGTSRPQRLAYDIGCYEMP